MDATHKQEYRIRELETRSVTLFPGRAQIYRQIKDVPLKAGENQITIVGLTPTVDKDSIKVEGTGSAIITDIAVELLPNREIFEEVYPEYDEDGDSDLSSESEEEKAEEPESAALVEVREKIRLAEDQGQSAQETVNSANDRLGILNAYGTLVTTDSEHAPEVRIDEVLVTYRAEREKVFSDLMDGNVKLREVADTTQRLKKELKRLERQAQREKEKAAKLKRKEVMARQKEQKKANRKQQEALKERARLRREREFFWPKKVYTIRISLDANSYTPGSSRRNSIASGDVDLVSLSKDTGKGESSDAGSGTCDLSISYVTTDAYWSPAYDMVLSTTANTGHVCFDAQLTNQTSETWANCKITLSTPQADFSGLHDTIPTLNPWRVRLIYRANGGSAFSHNDIMYSSDEKSHRTAWANKQTGRSNSKPHRSELFGYHVHPFAAAVSQGRVGGAPGYYASETYEYAPSQGAALFGNAPSSSSLQRRSAHAIVTPAQLPTGSGLFSASSAQQAPAAGGLFGAVSAKPASGMDRLQSSSCEEDPAPAPATSSLFGAPVAAEANVVSDTGIQNARKSKASIFSRAASLSMPKIGSGPPLPPPPPGPRRLEQSLYRSQSLSLDEETILPEAPAELAFQESTFEETGFTTTYDLPGLKTLAPASTASKQRVARIGFANVAFSHTVVAKYKPVAYLQAKLRNGNKLTLLPGPAGLTLDGSFLGRTDMPRCSPGDSFTLSLGVDPAIQVAYPKPDVRRSQSGVFNKEDSAVYTRTISLTNTRSLASSGTGTETSKQQQPKQPPPARVTVLDQVPVSEDERLRIEVLQPRGLALAGAGVPAGQPGREGKDEKDWGKAVATLKKGGEVSWDVTLHAGRMVKLGLEYQCAFPTGDHAVNV
ncbi:hypothetical protein PG999_008393 [Apiospora kogelbergensis]|uniref:DUF4139 domain-containing protein n=1 Tax=Apiospora kogelbergensis TaxID=1337665 RepID=A0AAW0QHK3_9PEZI